MSFEIVAPYTIRMQFDDGLERTINFEPILYGEIYEPLHEPSLFNAVRLDAELKTLIWPNGADFDPETLHNWDQYEPTWVREAEKQMQLT